MSDGDTLFGRRCRVTIVLLKRGSFSETDASQNAIEIDGADDPTRPGLRVRFKITKTTEKNPNQAEVTITNLAPSTRSALQNSRCRVTVEAGYASTGIEQLFLGDSRTVDHVRAGADWETVIKCGDAERAIRYARASESFGPNVTVGRVVQYCAEQLGVPLGNTAQQAAVLNRPLYQGWTVFGSASQEMDRALRAVGYSWSVQDGQIQILAPGESLTNSVPEVTPETGLVGSPEMGSPEKDGKPALCKFRSLLLPAARAGGRVRMRSERYDGVFRIKHLVHDGDVRGGNWYTEMQGIIDPTASTS